MAMLTPERHIELQRTWEALLRFALWKHVPFHDAEDLVSGCLRKGLDRYDGGRGELLPFCTTILSNAIKNYWRDRKTDLPIDGVDLSSQEPDPDMILEEKERIEQMRMKIEKLSKLLSPEELLFMKAFGEVIDELGGRAVSETARRLKIEPDKGWDIFRRIQRKAKSLAEPLPLYRSVTERRLSPRRPEEEREQSPLASSTFSDREASYAPSIGPGPSRQPLRPGEMLKLSDDDVQAIAAAMARAEAFGRFVQSLSS